MAIDGEGAPDGEASGADRVGALLRRVAQGDHSALGRVYDATSARAFGGILQIVGDRSRAEQVLQDAYLRVWSSAGEYRPTVDGTAWVLGMAERAALRSAGDAAPSAASGARTAAQPEAPPLTSRSTLLAAVDAETAGGANGTHAEPDGRAARRRERVSPAVDPAPTTNTLQAIERTTWTRGLLLFVAAMIVLVGLGWASATIHEVMTRTPADAALAEIEDAPDNHSATGDLPDGGTVGVRWAESIDGAVIVSDDLARLDGDRRYAAWVLADDEARSLGTFNAERDGRTTAQLTGDIDTGDLVTVTIEPADGATDTPTGEVVVEIPTG